MPRRASVKTEAAEEALQGPELMFEELDGLPVIVAARNRRNASRLRPRSPGRVTQKQTATLWLINANIGVQVSVAAALGMDRATMMAITDRLEARGLLVRKRSTIDRRRQELYLTPAGEKALRKVKACIIEHEQHFRSLFEPAELAALLSALEKFRAFG
jgi:DNA-binding MarR family transcriptional regulator